MQFRLLSRSSKLEVLSNKMSPPSYRQEVSYSTGNLTQKRQETLIRRVQNKEQCSDLNNSSLN